MNKKLKVKTFEFDHITDRILTEAMLAQMDVKDIDDLDILTINTVYVPPRNTVIYTPVNTPGKINDSSSVDVQYPAYFQIIVWYWQSE